MVWNSPLVPKKSCVLCVFNISLLLDCAIVFYLLRELGGDGGRKLGERYRGGVDLFNLKLMGLGIIFILQFDGSLSLLNLMYFDDFKLISVHIFKWAGTISLYFLVHLILVFNLLSCPSTKCVQWAYQFYYFKKKSWFEECDGFCAENS